MPVSRKRKSKSMKKSRSYKKTKQNKKTKKNNMRKMKGGTKKSHFIREYFEKNFEKIYGNEHDDITRQKTIDETVQAFNAFSKIHTINNEHDLINYVKAMISENEDSITSRFGKNFSNYFDNLKSHDN